MVHNVTVESLDNAQVEVSDFIESEYCQISADSGPVHVNRIKTESLTVNTETGEVLCTGHIQGSVKITSASGNVVGEQRFIGPSLDVSTDTGDIRIASSYSDQVRYLFSQSLVQEGLNSVRFDQSFYSILI